MEEDEKQRPAQVQLPPEKQMEFQQMRILARQITQGGLDHDQEHELKKQLLHVVISEMIRQEDEEKALLMP